MYSRALLIRPRPGPRGGTNWSRDASELECSGRAGATAISVQSVVHYRPSVTYFNLKLLLVG